MELFFLCGLILSVFLVSLCCVVFLLYHNSYASLPNLPRGKMGLPFIGESLEFLSTGRKGHPEKFIYDRMAKFSSQVFKTSILELVTTWWPNSVNKIFPSTQKSSSNKESKNLRKLLPNIMKAEALQRYIDPKHVAKFEDPFSFLASGVISIPINFPETAFNRAIKASNLMRKELRAIIKQRKIDLAENKASPTQDILSHMLLTSDENGQYMNEMDIADKIIGLLIGGHDTASTGITFVVKYLAEFPDIYNEVLKEQMEIAKSKKPGELLNWDDIQKMWYSWNVASEFYWSANSTHRNPEFFPEPEKFDPSRFEGNGPLPYSYVPFGGGPRMCPGKEYARMEILVFMHNVVKRFIWEKLLPDEKIIVNPMPIPAKGLPVPLLPHNA
ncbi:hypothetical protein SO802_007929 [Lithocarpus litseifolius]|uniref:Cytochrome P450 n=1 Tax=Lithocarpus litseifolius TaxID=425828 RepID=A0AAW2DQY8_9ROSI